MSDSFKPAQQLHAARFALGSLVATPGALGALQRLGVHPLQLILRHVTGDFGDLDAEDQHANEVAIALGYRVFSAYTVRNVAGDSERLYVITEADRSSTCTLLPSEY